MMFPTRAGLLFVFACVMVQAQLDVSAPVKTVQWDGVERIASRREPAVIRMEDSGTHTPVHKEWKALRALAGLQSDKTVVEFAACNFDARRTPTTSSQSDETVVELTEACEIGARWTPETASLRIAGQYDVHVGPDSRFVYFQENRPGPQGWEPEDAIVKMSVADFWLRARLQPPADLAAGESSNNESFVYASIPFFELPKAVVEDFQPIEFLDPHDETPRRKTSSALWMGAAGVRASWHYDRDNNFFVQLHGQKKFEIASPRAWQRFYPFPAAHPQERQSQVDAGAVNLKKFPNFRNITIQEVTLNPGDILYLPPYYWHQVTAVSESISVNVWSSSAEFGVLVGLEKSHVPMFLIESAAQALSRESFGEIVRFFTDWFKFTVDTLHHQPKSHIQFAQWLRARYRAAYGPVPADARKFCESGGLLGSSGADRLTKEQDREISDFARYVVSTLKTNNPNPYIQDMMLAQFAEKLFVTLLRQHANPYVQLCLR